jgi:outer membrane protein OmpA-like peptidoglycan-associated protein
MTPSRMSGDKRWTPTPSHERQADVAARARVAKNGRDGILNDNAPGSTGPGRPLPAHQQAAMERKLGRDFSNVRVHTGSRVPGEVGAKAFAYGRDIVFGPGHYQPQVASGRDLIAHELAHVAQQAALASPAVQKEGDKPAAGIGAAPPAEPFQRASDPAPEDSSVLFALDKADLSAADKKALTQAAGSHKGPVTVQLHGYASNEGQGPSMVEYNMNLSAHRAVAVKAFLEGKLPAGSKFVLFAHGETTAFAPIEQNRRVGLTIKDGVEGPEDTRKKTEADAKKDAADPKKTDESKTDLSAGGLGPRFTSGRFGPYRPLSPYLQVVPPLGPPYGPPPTLLDIDWEGLHSKAADHGMRLDSGLGAALERHWNYSYNFFYPFLGRDLSITASNLATNYMFGDWLSTENPNAFDRFNKDFKLAYPNEKHLIVPFLSSDTLDWVRMKLKGNKKDDYFFRF